MPLDSDEDVTDDGRICAALPTLNELRDAGARIATLAHLGRPKGEPDPRFSPVPVAAHLGELLSTRTKLATDVVGPSVKVTVGSPGDGGVVLLENVRFRAGEKPKGEIARKEPVGKYAAFGDLFIFNGFGVVHRKEVPAHDIVKLLPLVAGSLVKAKIDVLERLTESPKCLFAVVLGGAKVVDKLVITDNPLKTVDIFVIGSGTAFTFLKVQGLGMGNSLVDDAPIEACTGYLKAAEVADKHILLPVDVRVASEVDSRARAVGQMDVALTDATPADKMGLDTGSAIEELLGDAVCQARSMFWNSPMEVFEISGLESGTQTIAQTLAEINGISVVDGGGSASAVQAFGLPEDTPGRISTGGGTSLELTESKIFPGIVILKEGN